MRTKILEKDVSQLIADYFFAEYRIILHRRNTGGMVREHKGKKRFVRFSAAGQADRWGIQPKTGRHVEIEVKREGKEPTDDQYDWLASCRADGAIAIWADSLEMAISKYEESSLSSKVVYR